MTTIYPVILSGGSGTRLWPLSREHYPKQLLALAGDRTMLQETALRLDGLNGIQPPVLVCNEEHRFLVAEQMRALGKIPAAIILEPAGRNTAPALTLAALFLVAKDPDAAMLAMPADHVIQDVPAFQAAVKQAARSGPATPCHRSSSPGMKSCARRGRRIWRMGARWVTRRGARF